MLLDLPVDGVGGEGAGADQDLVRGRGGDRARDDFELGFGGGDDGCMVGHFEGCFEFANRTYHGKLSN